MVSESSHLDIASEYIHLSIDGPVHTVRVLKTLYYNARSVLNKLQELIGICISDKPDIVCIVESCLSMDISNNEVVIQGYNIICPDRDRHGGGILIYVHEFIPYKVILSGTLDLELVVLSIPFHCTTPSYFLVHFIDHRHQQCVFL